MGQRDDLGDAFRLKRRDVRGQRRHLVLEGHVRPGRRGLDRVRRQRRDDADPLAADVQHDVIGNLARQHVRRADVDVAGDHREADPVDEFGQFLGAVVEFVVADRHDVEADLLHHLGLDSALVGRVHQAALELVARIQHDHVPARRAQGITQFVDLGRHPRDAAKALGLGLVLLGTGAVEAVDRFDAAVHVVDVQDVQRVFGLRRRRAQRQARGQEQRCLHVGVSLLRMGHAATLSGGCQSRMRGRSA